MSMFVNKYQNVKLIKLQTTTVLTTTTTTQGANGCVPRYTVHLEGS